MVDVSYGSSFLYKTPKKSSELFEHLSENSHFCMLRSHIMVFLGH